MKNFESQYHSVYDISSDSSKREIMETYPKDSLKCYKGTGVQKKYKNITPCDELFTRYLHGY